MEFGDNSSEQMDGGNFAGIASQSTTNSVNSADDFSSSENAQQNGNDVNELLGASPFGRLLDIPGVDGAEDIFGNIGSSQQGGDNPFSGTGSQQGGGNTFSGAGSQQGGGNPFANFNPLEDGNPFVEGDEPDISEFGGGSAANNSEMENTNGDSSSEIYPEGEDSYEYDFSRVEGEYDFSGYESSETEGEYDISGTYPEGEDSYEYDFSRVEGEYDFSGYESSETEGEYDISGTYPEGEDSYEYDFSRVEGEYDFSSDGENPLTGGISFDTGREIPFEGGSEAGGNPFASGSIPSADTGMSFGGMMGGFDM